MCHTTQCIGWALRSKIDYSLMVFADKVGTGMGGVDGRTDRWVLAGGLWDPMSPPTALHLGRQVGEAAAVDSGAHHRRQPQPDGG